MSDVCDASIGNALDRDRLMFFLFQPGFVGKMGKPSDPSAVVDSHGRVLGGIQGLRIVDASVFPLLPPGQPMSTVCKSSLFSPAQSSLLCFSLSLSFPQSGTPLFD